MSWRISCTGRTRLLFAGMKGNAESLEALRQKALQLSGVVDAEIRPLTGNLIMAHWGTTGDLISEAGQAGVLTIASAQPNESAEQRASHFVGQIESQVKELIGGGLDLRMLAALAFVIMAIRQIARGAIAPPAATALWNALLLLLAERGLSKMTNSDDSAAD